METAALDTRLAACADRIAQLREDLDAECDRRDRLVVELRDLGRPWAEIARSARLSVTRCFAIVADSGSAVTIRA